MIQIKPRSASPKLFESGTVNHPEQTGTSYVEYTLNHNFGTPPDLISMDRYYPSPGEWIPVVDFFVSSSTNFNHATASQSSYDPNISKIRVFRLSSGSWSVKFKCFLF